MTEPKRLFRLPSSGRIAGVCAGIADYFGVDVTVVRIGWVVLSVVPGGFVGGVLAYLAAWFIMPVGTGAASGHAEARVRRSRTNRKIAGVCGGLAEHFELDPTLVRLAWAVLTVVPGCIIFGVFIYLVAWLVIPSQPVQPLQAASPAA